jgi:hypothetical protein
VAHLHEAFDRLAAGEPFSRPDVGRVSIPAKAAPVEPPFLPDPQEVHKCLHSPGEWEEVFYQHQTQQYDFAAFLFESML